MDRVSDFKPLEKVTLPGIGDIRCSGLTLIVGPNSSGKTQLLHDLYQHLSGAIRHSVVASDVRIRKADYSSLLRCLESEGYFRTHIDDNGVSQLIPQTTYFGPGQQVQPVPAQQAQAWYATYSSIDNADGSPTTTQRRKPIEFLSHFGRMLVSALFLDRRLVALGSVGLIDFEIGPPQHDLHVLHVDDAARDELMSEILASFGKAVWSDASRGSRVCLRVSDEKSKPTAEQRLSVKKMSEYRTIETEGDGLKSYIATCIAILLGRRPITLIDEPEMCLHPPQAYNLGRFIGRHGSSLDTATFVATHSSQILRGVLQETKQLQIIRLTQRDGSFSAHLVPADVLTNALSRPTLRAETVLDGIFAQCVVVLEADTDRLVYQTTLETLSKEIRLDVHFAAVGGTGGIAGTCALYRKLNIPIAIIADLDMVADLGRLRSALEVMVSTDIAQSLVDQAKTVIEAIRMMPPSIEPDEFKIRLKAIDEMEIDWQEGNDVKIRRALDDLSDCLDRMRRLKRGGISKLPEDVARPLESLVTALNQIGVFLVPVGELEEWLASESIAASRRNKWQWANEAALAIQAKGVAKGDIWDFMRAVANYLGK